MSSAPDNPRPPLTDSPWFWLYLFCTAGMLAVAWQSVRYGDRQSQLDRQFQGRRHITQQAAEEDSSLPFSTADDKIQSLRPLYVVLALALAAGWIGLWWQRFRLRKSVRSTSSAGREEAPS